MSPPPDFIFLDINLPKMDGFECLEEIKKDAGLKDIPVIIYTTSKSKKDYEKSQLLGAAGFLSKPSLFQEFKNELKSILRGTWVGYFHQTQKRNVE